MDSRNPENRSYEHIQIISQNRIYRTKLTVKLSTIYSPAHYFPFQRSWSRVKALMKLSNTMLGQEGLVRLLGVVAQGGHEGDERE